MNICVKWLEVTLVDFKILHFFSDSCELYEIVTKFGTCYLIFSQFDTKQLKCWIWCSSKIRNLQYSLMLENLLILFIAVLFVVVFHIFKASWIFNSIFTMFFIFIWGGGGITNLPFFLQILISTMQTTEHV